MASQRSGHLPLTLAATFAALTGVMLAVGLGTALIAGADAYSAGDCGGSSGASPAVVLAAGGGLEVGATEFGGPGDPLTGTHGARGDDLTVRTDSYAELGGRTWDTATALGGLPYMTALRISWGGHSVIAFKRDFGFGGAPVSGHRRAIDLWWELAARLGIPYENGLWSGVVRVRAVSAAELAGLGFVASAPGASASPGAAAGKTAVGAPARAVAATQAGPSVSPGLSACGPVPTTPGPKARVLSGGRAAAPSGAPAAVQAMIAAGNRIAGVPYVWGGGHGQPLSQIQPGYDCSSSVEHLLWAGGLVAAGYTPASGALETFGAPGPGRWVTIFTNADHVFMYVAGVRWDTAAFGGPGDGPAGIGWHPGVHDPSGFIERHPVGL